MAVAPSATPSTTSAATVVLVLLSVALRGIIGALLLSIALLLSAIARLLAIAPTLGLPIAAALRTAAVTAGGVAGSWLLSIARVRRLLPIG